MSTLSVLWGSSTKRLAFAVSVRDHFYGTPLVATLELSLTGRPEQPVPASSGGPRHADGTYRFLSLPDGAYTLEVNDPSARWSIADTPLALALPLASPGTALALEARPTPQWSAPPGRTILRARLEKGGLPLGNVELAIDAAAGTFVKNTRTDADGEAVHPIVGAATMLPDGRIALVIQVTGEAVLQTEVDGLIAAGATFHAQPGRTTRVRVSLSP